MVLSADQQLGEVGVLLDRADHDPAEIAPKPHQNLLEQIVGEGALGLHPLQLHRDRAGLGRSDPDREDATPVLLPQNYDRRVRGSIEAKVRDRYFDHRLIRLRSGIPTGQVLHLLRGQRVDRDAHGLQLEASDFLVDRWREAVDRLAILPASLASTSAARA